MEDVKKLKIIDCIGRIIPDWSATDLFSLPLPSNYNIGREMPQGIVCHLGLHPPSSGSFFKVKILYKPRILHDNVRDEYEKLSNIIASGMKLDPGSKIPNFVKHGDFDGIWLSAPRTLVVVNPSKFRISSYGVG
jgi:hypothetical protein